MSVLNIITKEFKQNIRNWKANIMMVLFPIVLMIILGAAFSGVFNNNIEINDMKVLYTVNADEQLASAFRDFTNDIKKNTGISFEETSDVDKGIASAKDVVYSCYVLVTDKPEEIKIYKNNRYSLNANLLKSMISTFTTRYSAMSAIAKSNPQIVSTIMADTAMDFVKTQSLDGKRQPGSMDYYGVTMLTLIVMYASMTGLWAIKSEQLQKTGNRMLCSPVNSYEILVGKVLGGILVTIVQFGIVILVSKYILKVYWGSNIWVILLIILSEAIMAISIGTGIAYLIKNDGAANGLLNTLIPIIVFFGGGYMPLSQMSGDLLKITNISPLKWVNDSIFRVVYDGDYSKVIPAIAINLVVAAVFVVVSAVFTRKEAA